jgi:hypothetical protein
MGSAVGQNFAGSRLPGEMLPAHTHQTQDRAERSPAFTAKHECLIISYNIAVLACFGYTVAFWACGFHKNTLSLLTIRRFA